MSQDFRELFGDWDPNSEGRLPEGEPENRGPRPLDEKPVSVVGVFQHADVQGIAEPHYFVLLQDSRGRTVPIWIGRFEAAAISMAMEGEQADRPMTHDLIRLILERTGVRVQSVIVDDLWQDTFYAKLCLVQGDRSIDIDCRPSDAIAIAVRTGAPILMAESVLEAVEQKS